MFFLVLPAHKKIKGKAQNGNKKSYASHVTSTDSMNPMHGQPEEFMPDFNFHYKTHDIPNENELSLMINGNKPKKSVSGGVSLLNIAKEAADKALNGKVIPNDDADKLGWFRTKIFNACY